MPFSKPYAHLISEVLTDRVRSVTYPLVTHPQGCYTLSEDCYSGTLSVRTSPETASWDRPIKNRQDLLRERDEWVWLLQVKFDSEVNTEELEASFEENPPRVVRDTDHDQQVDLLLVSANYTFPVQNQPAQGLTALYRFDAVKTPL